MQVGALPSTGLPERTVPPTCAWINDQILDTDFSTAEPGRKEILHLGTVGEGRNGVPSLAQFVKQCLSIFKVEGIKAFGESVVDFHDHSACLTATMLIASRRESLVAARNSHDLAC
jgi:hypothetical protein